jgi:hypothetical protein
VEDTHHSGEEVEDFVAEAGVPVELPPLSSVSAAIKRATSLITVPVNGLKRENTKG